MKLLVHKNAPTVYPMSVPAFLVYDKTSASGRSAWSHQLSNSSLSSISTSPSCFS
jgi:hypothetical protein